MRAIQHPSNNRVLGAPAGWDQAQMPCDALPITDATLDGVPHVVSFWLPTPAELAILNAGGAVALWIVGRTMPPVAISAEPRFT
jgi:hypothetical protein